MNRNKAIQVAYTCMINKSDNHPNVTDNIRAQRRKINIDTPDVKARKSGRFITQHKTETLLLNNLQKQLRK